MYEATFLRFLAFSTISHMGFIVLGCVAATPDAYFASIYYILIYILHNIILFSILLIFVDYKVAQSPIFLLNKLQTLVSVRQSNFLIAVLLSIVFLSMAGIPPFIGFFAKFFIFKALLDNGYIGLCLLGLIASLFSSVYYIRCVRFLFFTPDDRTNYLNIDYSKHFILVSISIFFSFIAIMLIFAQSFLIIYLQIIILNFFFI
jgi:NADH-quinone oxidoreductase subunit N